MVEHHEVYSQHRKEAQKLMREKYSRQQIALTFERQLAELVK